MPHPLSIIVHTRNEEHQIERCLKGLQGWATEVIVCDMASDDGTLARASSLCDRILSIPYIEEFDAARNLSAREASQPWILFLDADEVLTETVMGTIAELLLIDDESVAAYQLPFKTISFGKWIQHSGNWWPSYKSPPLLRKGRFSFTGKVHDPARVDGSVVRVTPRNEDDAILHFSHRDFDHYLGKLIRYTGLELEKRPVGSSTWEDAAREFGRTLRWYYDETAGVKDGMAGFLLSFGSALYEATTHLKEMERSGSVRVPPSAETFLRLALEAASGSATRAPKDNREQLPALIPGSILAVDAGKIRVNVQTDPGFWIDWEGPSTDPAKHVELIAHANALRVLGGGEVQLFESARSLWTEGIGVEVGVGCLPGRGELSHVFSLHMGELGADLIRSGKPYVLSPIYWDRGELQWIAPRILSAVQSSETLHSAVQAFDALRRQAADLRESGHFVTALSEQQRDLVRNATVITPNAEKEAQVLSASMGEELPLVQVVPNAIRPSIEAQTFEGLPSEPFVLCVGRVEHNKNQLALALACRVVGVPLVIIGSEWDAGYSGACRRVAGDNALFLGSLPRAQIAYAMQHAAVHCLPSFAETPGLVNLEAAALGRPIVCSARGAEREYFGDHALYCDPLNLISIAESIEQAIKNPRTDAYTAPTWSQVGQTLADIYGRVLNW